MKQLSLVLLGILIFGAINASAQDDEYKTIFSEKEISRVAGFGGPDMSFGMINGQFANFMGGGGGILFNSFFLGGYGTGLTNSNLNRSDDTEIISYGHGGLWFGYEFNYHNAIHPVVSLKTGWGSAETKNEYSHDYEDHIFVLTPMIGMEANITRFFKVRAGVECQVAAGINHLEGLSEEDFLAPAANISFLFGWF